MSLSGKIRYQILVISVTDGINIKKAIVQYVSSDRPRRRVKLLFHLSLFVIGRKYKKIRIITRNTSLITRNYEGS
jgi:hypothetical protein